MPAKGPHIKRGKGWWVKAEERRTSRNQGVNLSRRFEKANSRALKAWVKNRQATRFLEERLKTLDDFLRQKSEGLPAAETKRLQAERVSLVEKWANTRARAFGNALSARIFEHVAKTTKRETPYQYISEGDQQAFVRLAANRVKKILLLRLSLRGTEPTVEQARRLRRMQQALRLWLNHWGLNVSETSMHDWMSGDLVRFA